MQEELLALLGAGWSEHTSERKGYRNGSKVATLVEKEN